MASKKAYEVSKKLHYILAIELMCVVQALDFLAPLSPSPTSKAVYEIIRKEVPTVTEDRLFYQDMESIFRKVFHGEITEKVESMVGKLEF